MVTNAPIDDDHMGQAFWDDYRSKVCAKESAYVQQTGMAEGLEGWSRSSKMPEGGKRLRMSGVLSGAAGLSSILVGALWLGFMFDFSVPWYTVFPAAALVAGGAFIVAAITYEARSEKQEVHRDRCDH